MATEQVFVEVSIFNIRANDYNKLLNEQPNIDGIALPGMPIGTPGMPGNKDEPYVIYQLVDGKYSVFMTI